MTGYKGTKRTKCCLEGRAISAKRECPVTTLVFSRDLHTPAVELNPGGPWLAAVLPMKPDPRPASSSPDRRKNKLA